MDINKKKIISYDFDSFFLVVLIATVPFIPFSPFRIKLANFSLSLPIIIMSFYIYLKTIVLIKNGLKTKIKLLFSFLLLSFLVLGILSTVWSKYENWNFIIELTFYIFTVLFFINFCEVKSATFFKLNNLLAYTTFFIILIGFLRLAKGQSIWFEFEDHFKTGLGTRNSDIFMVVAALPTTFSLLFLQRNFFHRIKAIFVILSFVIAIFLSLSRGQLIVSLFMLFVMPLIYALLTKANLKAVFKFMIVALVITTIWLIVFNNFLQGNYQLLIKRFYNVAESERFELAKYAWSTVKAHPFTGVGLGNFKFFSPEGVHAHNAFLNIFAELGLLGFVLFSFILFQPAFGYLKLYKRVKYFSAYSDKILYVHGFSTIIILITSSFFQTFYNFIFFWIIYMLSYLELSFLNKKDFRGSLGRNTNEIL